MRGRFRLRPPFLRRRVVRLGGKRPKQPVLLRAGLLDSVRRHKHNIPFHDLSDNYSDDGRPDHYLPLRVVHTA